MTNPLHDMQARFDAVASDWDSQPRRITLAKAVVEAVRAAVPLRPDMRALDVGAGTGLVSLGLLAHVADLTAADASPGMLRVLEEKARGLGLGHRLHTRQIDLSEGEWPAGSFDLIVSSMTLHHLPDVPGVLRRLRPALRPGGWIALADLDTEDGSFHADKTGVYHSGFDRAELCRWLSEAGFASPAARDAHRMTKPGADGVTRDYPIFLAAAQG